MTRKDYNNIAFSLALAEPASPNEAREAWKFTCRKVAEGLAVGNSRFDKSRFLEACKFDYWKNKRPPY